MVCRILVGLYRLEGSFENYGALKSSDAGAACGLLASFFSAVEKMLLRVFGDSNPIYGLLLRWVAFT